MVDDGGNSGARPLVHRIGDIEKNIALIADKIEQSLQQPKQIVVQPQVEKDVLSIANELNILAEKVNEMAGELQITKAALNASNSKAQPSDEVLGKIKEDIREIKNTLGVFDKKMDFLETQCKKTNEDVYTQLDEVVDLIIVWEKRLAHLEEQINSIESADKNRMEEISNTVRSQTAEVKIMKAKQDIIGQLKRMHEP